MKKILLVLLLPARLLAQTESDTVEIKRNYRPDIMKAEKLYSKPLPETAYVEPPPFNYQVVPRQLDSLSPRMGTYKAIALPADKLKRLYGNFLKVGYGNFNTPLIQGSLMTLRNRDYSGGMNLNHYSNNGSLSRKMAETELEAFGKTYRGQNVLSVDARLCQRNFRFYGMDSAFTDSFTSDQTKLGYTNLDLNGQWQHQASADSNKPSYGGGIDYYTMTDRNKNTEQAFVLSANLRTYLSKSPLTVALTIDANGIKGAQVLNRTFVKLAPAYQMGGRNLKLLLGANAIFLNSTADPANPNQFIIRPRLDFSYHIERNKLKITAGINGDWQKNTLRSLSLVNPFLASNSVFDNTAYTKVFAGISGGIRNNTFWLIQGQFTSNKNMALFMTEKSDTADMLTSLNRFIVAYDDVKVAALHVEINHTVAEKIKFQMSGNLYKYTLASYTRAWNLPTADLRLHGGYSLGDKLVLGADVYVMNSRYGNRFEADTLQSIAELKLPGFADFNLNADYRYSKQVSAFLQLNNLTAARYQRWYRYPVAGINVLAGLTIHF